MFKKLREVLNEDEFESLLGITGDVSLIFVIDTSGSMGDEIEAAKKIAKAIAAHRRDAPVQYILAPFSDPCKYLSRGGLPYKNDVGARRKLSKTP